MTDHHPTPKPDRAAAAWPSWILAAVLAGLALFLGVPLLRLVHDIAQPAPALATRTTVVGAVVVQAGVGGFLVAGALVGLGSARLRAASAADAAVAACLGAVAAGLVAWAVLLGVALWVLTNSTWQF